MRVGSGLDVHAFGPGDHVTIGGVRIPYERGIVAHSDGDVALHALCDALLGAMGLGDIGQHFPDTDERWKGADSRRFVRHCAELLRQNRWRLVNADFTILAEAPRLDGYRIQMCQNIADDLGVRPARINIKATTMEAMGPVGRREGLACQAIVLLAHADDPNHPHGSSQ